MCGRGTRLFRREAEDLIDLIERHAAHDFELMLLADELREQWGMAPYPVGTLRPRAAVDGDI